VIEVALPAFAADRRAAAQLLLRARACCTARPMRDITNRALGRGYIESAEQSRTAEHF